jgi:hypothetical protein
VRALRPDDQEVPMKDKKRIKQLPALDADALAQVHGGWPPDPIVPLPAPLPSNPNPVPWTVSPLRAS